MNAALAELRIDPARIPRLMELGLIKSIAQPEVRSSCKGKGGRPSLVAVDKAEALYLAGGVTIREACERTGSKIGTLIYRLRVKNQPRRRGPGRKKKDTT